jgi:hypothetical protein
MTIEEKKLALRANPAALVIRLKVTRVSVEELDDWFAVGDELGVGDLVNVQDTNGDTVLHAAFRSVIIDPQVVRAILRRNPNLEIQNRLKQTPFTLAYIYGTLETIKDVLNQGPNLDRQTNTGRTVAVEAILYMPFFNHSLVAIDDLIAASLAILEKKPNLEIRDNKGNTFLMCLVENHTPVPVIEAVLDMKPDLSVQNNDGKDVFALAQHLPDLPVELGLAFRHVPALAVESFFVEHAIQPEQKEAALSKFNELGCPDVISAVIFSHQGWDATGSLAWTRDVLRQREKERAEQETIRKRRITIQQHWS